MKKFHEIFEIERIKNRFPVFAAEIGVVFGVLGYVFYQKKISFEIFILLTVFAGLLFALYYGVKGAIAASVAAGLIVYLTLKHEMVVLLSRNYLETSFFLASLLITGIVKTGMEKKVVGMELGNRMINQRLERMTVDLSEKDWALQDAFREVLTDMDSPRIMYQALRRLEHLKDKETLFSEILYIFYRHCHVEISSIYEFDSRNRFKKVVAFGTSSLPDILNWKSEKMPEILRVARIEKEVIVPARLEHRLVMALPLLSASGNLLYVILLEEIRFINLNESLINLLKMAAFWIKNVIEHLLHLEDFLPYSVFSSVIVYRPDVSVKIIKQSVSSHKKYGLPFSFLRVTGEITEKTAKRFSAALRLYDEFFMTNEHEMVVLLSMVVEKNVPFVINRLINTFPDLEIETITDIKSIHGQ
ncbi:MAG: hypothetical protein KJ687_05145 [Proteobacteria bacterium]|nr:hypothetical protein [Pseudomonadota bacterium]